MGLFAIRTPAPVAPESAPPVDLGRTAAAVAIAQEVAALLDTTVEVTWWSLCNAPIEMADLLDTPQGWSAYAGYIARDLGMPGVEFSPGVH